MFFDRSKTVLFVKEKHISKGILRNSDGSFAKILGIHNVVTFFD